MSELETCCCQIHILVHKGPSLTFSRILAMFDTSILPRLVALNQLTNKLLQDFVVQAEFDIALSNEIEGNKPLFFCSHPTHTFLQEMKHTLFRTRGFLVISEVPMMPLKERRWCQQALQWLNQAKLIRCLETGQLDLCIGFSLDHLFRWPEMTLVALGKLHVHANRDIGWIPFLKGSEPPRFSGGNTATDEDRTTLARVIAEEHEKVSPPPIQSQMTHIS